MDIVHVGYPIRKSPVQWMFAPHRSLSQLATSFIGSWCQGIPLALFIAWPIENELYARSLIVNYAGFTDWNCKLLPIIYLDVVPQLKLRLLPCSFKHRTSLLPYFTCNHHIVQFSRCRTSNFIWSQISKSNSLGFEIQQQRAVWWARVGSNHRPCDYQSHALASWATGPYLVYDELVK